MTKRPLPSGLMTATEVAEHFGCGVSTVWRWAKTGVLPQPIRIGGSTRWRRSDIDALIDGSEAA
ncbi:MAG: helix-turn-helix domain-containing protein [Paracoccaceae bacterium]|nr:helix-turn-helix domain-containing protein [Paracoccaceae bacterium]